MPSTHKRVATAVYVNRAHDEDNVTFVIDVPVSAGNKGSDLTRKLLQGVAVHGYTVAAGRYAVTIKRMKR